MFLIIVLSMCFALTRLQAACMVISGYQARVQEFARGGGGAKSESLFLLFNFLGGGTSSETS